MKPFLIRAIPWIMLVSWLLANGCATDQAFMEPAKPGVPDQVVKTSVIQKISFADEDNFTRIQIEGSGPIPAPFYKLLSDPLRIVIDIPDIDLREIKEPLRINNGIVGEVVTTQFDDKGRVEIGLTQMTSYNISKQENALLIEIEKIRQTAESQEQTKEEALEKEPEIGAPQEPGKEELPTGERVEGPGAPETVMKESEIPPPADLKSEQITTVEPSAPPRLETLKKARNIVKLSFEAKKDFITFHIVADGRIGNYNIFKLDSPPRLVLDIWGVGTRIARKSLDIQSPFIKKVRTGKYPDKLRIVFDSRPSKLVRYHVNRMEDRMSLSFGSVPQPFEAQISLEGKLKRPVSTSRVQLRAPVEFIQFDRKSTIVLPLTGEPEFESRKPTTKSVEIDVKNGFVPEAYRKGLDTRAFECGVDSIDIKNLKSGEMSILRLSIQLREEVGFETIKEGKNLLIDIAKPKKTQFGKEPVPESKKPESTLPGKKEQQPTGEPKKEESSNGPKKEEVTAKQAKTEQTKIEKGPKEEQKPAPEPKSVEKQAAVPPPKPQKGGDEKKLIDSPEKVYTGSKLSLDFKDADIKNILRLIAEVSNFNIITGDDVAGRITMRLVDVPWDQALDLILQAKGLGMSKVGNVIRIAPIDSLKKEIQAELESKRVKEKLEDLFTEVVSVNYASAKEILPQVKSMMSERGDVKVDERTNILVVKDIARNVAAAKALVKTLDTKTPQVIIEARIIEANLAFQRELGVSWGFLAEKGTGKDRTYSVGGGGANESTLREPSGTVTTPTRSMVNLPAAGGSLLEFLFTSDVGLRNLDVAISAFEGNGDVRIISSPKIATLDNKEASVEQGLRIPYLKLTDTGTVTTEFIDANLKLTVTPHVTNDGHIRMSIKAKKDAPDNSITVAGVPSIDKKEAITEVMIKDGGVVAIAGIYTIEKTKQEDGVPLLKKIPLLGWLFKKETREDTRRDLLIFISPKIMKDQPT